MKRNRLQMVKVAALGALGAVAIAGGAYAATSKSTAATTGSTATTPSPAAAVAHKGTPGICPHGSRTSTSANST